MKSCVTLHNQCNIRSSSQIPSWGSPYVSKGCEIWDSHDRTFKDYCLLGCVLPIDTNWGVCSWPWQLLAQEKADRSLFVTSNLCIPVKIRWADVQFGFVSVLKHEFIIVLYVVTAVRKFDVLVTSETSNKWQPVERSSSNRQSVCILWPSSRVLRTCTHAVVGQLYSL